MHFFKPHILLAILFIILVFYSCRTESGNTHTNRMSFEPDSTSLKLKYADVVFTLPSPSQTLFLLKNSNLQFDPKLIVHPNKTGKYETTFKKSLILGMWSADINYLNLYNQKELALYYLQSIQKIMEELEIQKPLDSDFFTKVEELFGNTDSVVSYLSDAFRKCDEYLKYNDQQEIGALIIAGGWIESFYFLVNLYTNTNDITIFNLILYQKELINNLIKMLSKYYNKTPEYTEFIDKLVNIAYEFDVIDTSNEVKGIEQDTLNQITQIQNKTDFIISGSKPEKLITLVTNLRNSHL